MLVRDEGFEPFEEPTEAYLNLNGFTDRRPEQLSYIIYNIIFAVLASFN